MTISLYVYRKIAPFSLSNIDFTHTHIVVFLLSVVLPYFVAFYTEEVYKERNATRTPAQPKVVKSHIEKQRDLIQEIRLQKEIDNELMQLANGNFSTKEPQGTSEVVKELKETVVTPTVTGQQANSDTIITPQNEEVDLVQMLTDLQAKK